MLVEEEPRVVLFLFFLICAFAVSKALARTPLAQPKIIALELGQQEEATSLLSSLLGALP
jgi:hypothetical protein